MFAYSMNMFTLFFVVSIFYHSFSCITFISKWGESTVKKMQIFQQRVLQSKNLSRRTETKRADSKAE